MPQKSNLDAELLETVVAVICCAGHALIERWNEATGRAVLHAAIDDPLLGRPHELVEAADVSYW